MVVKIFGSYITDHENQPIQFATATKKPNGTKYDVTLTDTAGSAISYREVSDLSIFELEGGTWETNTPTPEQLAIAELSIAQAMAQQQNEMAIAELSIMIAGGI